METKAPKAISPKKTKKTMTVGPSKKKSRGDKLEKAPKAKGKGGTKGTKGKAKGKGKGKGNMPTLTEPSNTTAVPTRSAFDAFTGAPTAATP
jgi:hypothetical protein